MHPLVKDLHKMSDDDVLKTLSELYRKLGIAYQMDNAGGEVVQQLQLLIETYQEEYQKRMSAQAEKLNKYVKTSKSDRDIWDIE